MPGGARRRRMPVRLRRMGECPRPVLSPSKDIKSSPFLARAGPDPPEADEGQGVRGMVERISLRERELNNFTFRMTEADLEFMVLEPGDLPPELQGYQVVREGLMDNDTLAEHGFRGNTGERFGQAGRINGYVREFSSGDTLTVADGLNFVGSTVAHLFQSPEQVSRWMHDIFLKDFEGNVGESVGLGQGQQLVSVQRLDPQGFFDEAVALKVLQGGPAGLLSSTVIDFRVGRILGVAYVGTVGDHQRLEPATALGLALERRIVRVVLG